MRKRVITIAERWAQAVLQSPTLRRILNSLLIIAMEWIPWGQMLYLGIRLGFVSMRIANRAIRELSCHLLKLYIQRTGGPNRIANLLLVIISSERFNMEVFLRTAMQVFMVCLPVLVQSLMIMATAMEIQMAPLVIANS